MGTFLTNTGLQKVLEYILNTFSKKDHTHTKDDVTGLAQVAISGSYADLTNKPSFTPNVPDATDTQAGLVRPGTGLVVGNGGVLNVDVNAATGIFVNQNNKIDIKTGKGLVFYDGNIVSCVLLNNGWSDMYREMKNFVEGYGNENIIGVDFILRNNVEFVIKLTPDIIKNIKENTTYNYITTYMNGNGISISNLSVGDVTGEENIKAYETIRLMSDRNRVDAVGLKILQSLLNDQTKALEVTGRFVPYMVTVDETNTERFARLGLAHTEGEVNIGCPAYVLKNSDGGYIYVPLINLL